MKNIEQLTGSQEVVGSNPIFSTVKTEFEKFGGLLEKAQKNIQTGLGQLDQVSGVRTRAIQRKLKTVVSLGEGETELILPDITSNDIDDHEESEA